MTEGKQAKMEFPYTYLVEEMGSIVAPGSLPHFIYLSRSFLEKKLRAFRHDRMPIREGKAITKIGCPFCNNGFLKLTKVEPKYSGGMSLIPDRMERVGNEYEYICSNDECDARFIGTYQWAWID